MTGMGQRGAVPEQWSCKAADGIVEVLVPEGRKPAHPVQLTGQAGASTTVRRRSPCTGRSRASAAAASGEPGRAEQDAHLARPGGYEFSW